jgi:hypothetical protein
MRELRTVRAVAAMSICAAVAGGCTAVEETVHESVAAVSIAPAATEGGPKTLTLTADAVRRLELVTVVVDDATAVPYAAVVYDKKGAPWVYTNPSELTYVRVPITLDRVDGQSAAVSAGPPVGTRVVTRSAIKLYGAENGVGGGR